MLIDQSVEDELYAESARLRQNVNLPQGEVYHVDTPCTINNQISMLKQSGFSSANLRYKMGNMAAIFAKK
jgi:hypothetical protein